MVAKEGFQLPLGLLVKAWVLCFHEALVIYRLLRFNLEAAFIQEKIDSDTDYKN
jgi:hypothetical protein